MSEVRNNGRQILIDIIEDFNPDKFIRFFREKNRSFAPRREDLLQYDDDNFKNGIKLGKIKFAQDEQMVVCSFQAGQPLSERSGKKAQYEKGKKILKDSQSDAGIFIFYDEQGNFRFSLIYANYLGKHRDWSAFRRFTYFVSTEYTNKTFLQQIGEEDFSSLEKVKDAFSVEKVTKEFYTDIANWYFWVVRKAEFPKDAEAEENGRNIAVIRMITRLIFIWFMKERGLIRQNLFNYKNISTLLKDLSPKNTTYYKAILQNLFFATLNTKIEDRKFRFGKSFQGKNKDYMDHGIYRYEDYYKNKEDMLVVFKNIPFLNGGLFDCLDRRATDNGKNVEIRIDGFTDKEVRLSVPNQLFFSDEITVDLNKDYGTKNKKYKVRGLIDILSSYNFTIDENDPNDADVALDPELLGKVFENLLASFNPETATTARKQTGSFYTPREIVNYMVDESLMAYLSNKISDDGKEDNRVRQLFVHTDEPHQFNPKEADVLINAIDSAKILDPACGSGAFPMGILHKLVYLLGKLDPDNSKWKELQKQKAIKETEEAFNIGNKEERIKRLFDIDDAFENNSSDYGRKLYLIENCIFGVDIQPIAVQIAKLRFFISLLVDQNVTPKKENISIRPLPNLETKFVAANTLIGIERPAQGLLRNPEIDRKEAELHRVRERHFTARTPKIKQQCIEDDKRLRFEILNLQKKSGFPAGVTEKLANWDPYDQNASADFFDPKWMFGPDVKDGFDVVIGNPPYVDSETMTKTNPQFRDLLRPMYQSAKGNWDLFVIFIEKGLLLTRMNGSFSYIVPNKLLGAKYTEELRMLLLKKHFIEIRDYSDVNVFKEADVYPIVLVLKNTTPSSDVSMTKMSDVSSCKSLNRIAKNIFYKDIYWDCFFEETSLVNIILKVCKNDKLSTYFPDVLGAATVSEAYQIKEELRELDDPSKEYKKFINTGTIDKYCSLWGKKTTQYIKDRYYKPIILSSALKRISPSRLLQADRCKIIIAGMSKEIEAFYDKGDYLAGKSTAIILGDSEKLKVLMAILNSRLISFWLAIFYNSLAMAGGYFNVGNNELNNIPIASFSHATKLGFEKIVDQILAAKKKDPNADTSALEKQIDAMVYALYGLTPEEIAIVEGKK